MDLQGDGQDDLDVGLDPVDDPLLDPVEDPLLDPMDDPIEDPVPDPIEDPVQDPVEDPVQDPIEDPVQDPIEDPDPDGDPDNTCGAQATLTECAETTPAPTTSDGILTFVANNAIPLKCRQGGVEEWEFDIIRDELEGMMVFMMGEVHGSTEIGEASADLFEELARDGEVNVLAIEIAMDMSDALNTYVQTGNRAALDHYGFSDFPAPMMWRILPERARALALEGVLVTVVGVDTPWDLGWVNDQIEAIASDLEAEAAGWVLDTLPDAPRFGDLIDTDYVDDAEAYHQHILDHLEVICADLDTEVCDRLQFLASSLYLGAFPQSEYFYWGSEHEINAWFDAREGLIYTNYQAIFQSGDAQVYAHMGAAHTAKAGDMVADRLSTDFETTMGLVYTSSPAWGPGSEILYGGWINPLDPEPRLVSDILSDMEIDRYFLATHAPGVSCVENPFLYRSVALDDSLDAVYGDAYDMFFWFDLLTPEAEWRSRKGRSATEQRAIEHWQRMQEADARLLDRLTGMYRP